MGIRVLGTPVGSAAFVQETVSKRLKFEAQLWDAMSSRLAKSMADTLAVRRPKVHHILRTLPPSQ